MYHLLHTIPEIKAKTTTEALPQNSSKVILGKCRMPHEQFFKMTQETNTRVKSGDIIPDRTLTPYEETNRYNDFVTKFDSLIEKINELARSSGDISDKESVIPMLSEFENVIGNKRLENKTATQHEEKSIQQENETPEPLHQLVHGNQKIFDCINFHNDPGKTNTRAKYLEITHQNISNSRENENPWKVVNPYELTYQVGKEMPLQNENLIPPILNNKIPYIPVSQEFLKRDHYETIKNTDFISSPLTFNSGNKIQHTAKSLFVQDSNMMKKLTHYEKINNSLRDINAIDYLEEQEIERIRVLISGHITHKDFPVFIIHQNYLDLGILNKTPDFKCHKQEGNVEVFIKGHFFHENILVMENNSPVALDLKSHRFLIGKESTVLEEKFKNIFHLESADINLEGEFTMSTETFQYIPVFSLDIIKHSDFDYRSVIIPNTPYHNNSSQFCTLCSNSKGISTGKYTDKKSDKFSKSKSFIEKLKENTIFRFLLKGKEKDPKKSKKGEKLICKNEEEKLKNKTSRTAIQKVDKPSQFVTFEVHEEDTITSSSSKKELGEKTSANPKRKIIKRKRKRSNIAENPMIVQMQELFLS